MINTLTDIANYALAIIGEENIENIESNDTTPTRIRAILYQVIDEVSTSYKWSELTTRVLVNPDTVKDIDGNTTFTIPADCLRVLDVYSGYVPNQDEQALFINNQPIDYRLEGNKIILGTCENNWTYIDTLNDERPIKVIMIRSSNKPNEWGTLLTECIYHKTAIKLAHKITGNKSLTNSLIEEYARVIEPKAKRLQSYQNSSPITQKRKKYSRIRGARR